MISLKTLPQATAQEVYNQIARHLLTQNEKALDENRCTCAYRGPSGLKCAGGCFISDDEYTHDMEGRTWDGLANLTHYLPSEHSNLISEGQDIHDDYPPHQWPELLTSLAREFHLDSKVVEDFNPRTKR